MTPITQIAGLAPLALKSQWVGLVQHEVQIEECVSTVGRRSTFHASKALFEDRSLSVKQTQHVATIGRVLRTGEWPFACGCFVWC